MKLILHILLVAAILISLVSPLIIISAADEITDPSETPIPKKIMPNLIMPTPVPTLYSSPTPKTTHPPGSLAQPHRQFHRPHLQCNFKHLKNNKYHSPPMPSEQL